MMSTHLCPPVPLWCWGQRWWQSPAFTPPKTKNPLGFLTPSRRALEANPSSNQHPGQGQPSLGGQDATPRAGKVLFLLFIYIHLTVNSPAGEPAAHTDKHGPLVCAGGTGELEDLHQPFPALP